MAKYFYAGSCKGYKPKPQNDFKSLAKTLTQINIICRTMIRPLLLYSLLLLESMGLSMASEMAGSPLRPFKEAPKIFKLTTKIDGKVVVGQSVTLSSTVLDAGGKIVSCQWTSPFGGIYIVDKNGLTSPGGYKFDKSKITDMPKNTFLLVLGSDFVAKKPSSLLLVVAHGLEAPLWKDVWLK